MASPASTQRQNRRARLTRETILDGYIELADRTGVTEISLRALGDAMGADPTAIYRHFRDKAELLTAVTDRLLARVVDSYAPTGDWRDDLRSLALLIREVYLSHPQLARLLAHSPSSHPSNASLIEACLSALRSAGLSDADAAAAVELMENYVAGVSSLNAEMVTSENEAWRHELAALPPDRFPNVTSIADRLYREDGMNFEFGLDLFLDALESRARAGRPGLRRPTR